MDLRTALTRRVGHEISWGLGAGDRGSTGVEGIPDYVLVVRDTVYVVALAIFGTKFHTDRDRFGETY